MRFGICCSPATFGAPGSKEFAQGLEMLHAAGANYVEFPVAATSPEGDVAEFSRLQTALQNSPLRAEAFNVFLPAHHRITGPEVNLPRVLEYARVALERCRGLGGEVVVLGSAGARRLPEGFDRARGLEQFVRFCRQLGPVAQDAGVTMCIEPLNAREDNLLLAVSEGAQLVDEVAHPAIRLLADFYHMLEENEPLENVTKAGARLRHTHLADIGRVAPGFAVEGEADFKGFFTALKAAGYGMSTRGVTTHAARCSFEGTYDDIFTQTAPMMKLLQERWTAA